MNCKEIHPLLTQYLLGDLKADAADRVRAHVEKCSACQAELALLEPTLLLLNDALAEPATAQTRLESTRRKRVLRPVGRMRKTIHWVGSTHPKMSIAAGLVFVCGMIWTLLMPAMMKSRVKACSVRVMMPMASPHDAVKSGYLAGSLIELEDARQGPQAGMSFANAKAKNESRSRSRRDKRRDNISCSVSVVEPEPLEALEDIEEIPADAPELIDVSFAPPDAPLPRPVVSATPARKPRYMLVSSLREQSVAAPSQDVSVQPAEFDSVAMVKSPVVMKGMLGNRNPGSRAEALKRYGGGVALVEVEDEADIEVSVEDSSDKKSVGGGIANGRILYSDTDGDESYRREDAWDKGSSRSESGKRSLVHQRVGSPHGPATEIHRLAPEATKRKQVLSKLEEVRIPELDFKQAKLADIAKFFEQSSVAFGGDDDKAALTIAVTESQPDTSYGSVMDPFSVNSHESAERGRSTSNSERELDEMEVGRPRPAGVLQERVVDPFAAPSDDSSGPIVDDETLVTFRARDISLKEALDITADVAGMKYDIGKDGKIVMSPKNAAEGEIVHRMLDVPQGIMERFIQTGGEVSSREGSVDVSDLFSEQGVDCPSFASVKYNEQLGKLIAQNTLENIEVLERVVDSLREAEAENVSRFKAFGVNPFVKVTDQAFSTFAIDVDTAAYTLGRNYMQKGLLPPAESVRTEEYVNFFDYAYKAPTHKTFKVYTEVAPSKFGRGQHLLKIGVKGRRLGREEQRQASLTFLIDTSGSMNQADRLGLVGKSLALLVNEMNPDDCVAIVQYDSHARVVLESTPIANKAAILAAIKRLQCGGSTNLEEGMHRAYALAAANFIPKGENRVLLLSDGVANLGSGAAEDILKKVEAFRRQGITCSVFGFGMGTYDDTMLETLANKGDGAYAFIDSIAEARRVFVDDLSATLNTIAADVKIQVEYSPEYVAQYRQLGYENRQLKKQDFRNDAIDAGEVGSGQSVTALYELELTAPPAKPVPYGARCLPLDDVIATVRVRYRRIDTGAVEEIEHRVHQRDVLPRFDSAPPRFKLAAAVSEFSEILRGSSFAKGSSTEDVAAVLRPVALDLPLDKHVQELLRLVDRADSMSRGQ